MEDEKYFSETVKVITDKLTALGGLMMGLDSGSVEMKPHEVNALGFMVHDLGDELDSWNSERTWEEEHGNVTAA